LFNLKDLYLSLSTVVAIVDGLGDADPDVEQAEAGDKAAHSSVVEDGCEPGDAGDKHIAVPDPGPPGQNHDQDAEINAEQDQDEERQSLQPHGCRSFGGFGSGLGCLGYGRFRVGEKFWLSGHQTLKIDSSRAVAGCLAEKEEDSALAQAIGDCAEECIGDYRPFIRMAAWSR
jgi:hypothetical protein